MGASESAPPKKYGVEGGMKDEFRRGDRVLVLSRLAALNDPELVAKLRNHNPLVTPQNSGSFEPAAAEEHPVKEDDAATDQPAAVVSQAGPQEKVEQERQELVGEEVQEGEGSVDLLENLRVERASSLEAEKKEAEEKRKEDEKNQLPDYPRSCYGWVVLAVDYQAGIYAIQMADGSYLPRVTAGTSALGHGNLHKSNTTGKCARSGDLELLIRCDWTRGGVNGDKSPDCIPSSSIELPLSQQHESQLACATQQSSGVDIWDNLPKSSDDSGSGGGVGSGKNIGSMSPVGSSSLGTINTKTASKTTKTANEAKKKRMLCGARVIATTKTGKYSGIVACINSDDSFNIQSEFGDYLTSLKLESLECTEPITLGAPSPAAAL